MKPTKKQPILAEHILRSHEIDGVVQPVVKLFTEKNFNLLPSLKHKGDTYPNYGWKIIERYGETTKKVTKPPVVGDVQKQNNGVDSSSATGDMGVVDDKSTDNGSKRTARRTRKGG